MLSSSALLTACYPYMSLVEKMEYKANIIFISFLPLGISFKSIRKTKLSLVRSYTHLIFNIKATTSNFTPEKSIRSIET